MMFFILAACYLFAAGMAFPFILNSRVNSCLYTGHAVGTSYEGNQMISPCKEHHKFESVFMSVCAPVALPFVAGSLVANRQGRIEKRRARELAEAEHQTNLAKAQADRIKILEKESGIV